VTDALDTPDGAAHPRRSRFSRRLVVHTLGLVLAALLTWLVFRAYRDPGLLLDLSSAFMLC
jgi:hypothetical protein